MHTTSIRDFTKEKVLGKGSFGSVYLVRRKKDNKIYALKSVYMEKLNKKEQENSVNEVRILASVNHPNVIGYKEAFWDDSGSTLNIVMEYADDGDLHTKIENMEKEGGFFSEELIWSYSIQMIEGLKALHDKKIMHRDLKSANIFLVKDKHQCKLGDMNVSKVIKDRVLKTQTGTPYYASPEVWNDNPYSYKSDLWSIGCVIYELCELKPPFHGKDLDELYENVCKGKPKRIKKIYSDELWQMIMMLLKVDVDQRVDCNQFLNSKLVVKKIKELKENPITVLEGESLDKNKNTQDDFLLKTIKFNDIKEIKSQLPSKKNYNGNNKSGINHLKRKKYIRNSNNNKGNSNKINNSVNINNNNNNGNNEKYLQKIKNIEKEKENIKKELSKQIEYSKLKEYINNNTNNNNSNKKKNEDKDNKRISRTGNRIKDNYDNLLKHHQTVIYKTNNYNIPDINNNNNSCSNNKIIADINSERKKLNNLSDLYLKKPHAKINNNKVLNNKLSIISLTKKEKDEDKYKTEINNGINSEEDDIRNEKCYTSVHRAKKILINMSKEDEEESDIRNTINSNKSNKYIYNKKNIYSHIKKINIDLEGGNSPSNKRQSATPVYKRSPLLNPSLYKSNMGSNKNINKNKIYFTNKLNKQKITSPQNTHKFYSYGIALTSPNNITNKKNFENNDNNDNEIDQISISEKDGGKSKKYSKKINIKPQTNCREKPAKLTKKRIINNDDNNNENKSGILVNNSNVYSNKISLNTPKRPLLKCYLSPKFNNPQVFNNFYSINCQGNVNAPFKVINVFKK